MENIRELSQRIINNEAIIFATFSGIKNKSLKTFNKVTIKKVMIKNELKHQFEYIYDKNVEHKNLNKVDSINEIDNLLQTYFKQALINTLESDYHILVSKSGVAKINKKAATKKFEEISHNRKKKYILNEGEVTSFLVELGIMTADGKVINSSKCDGSCALCGRVRSVPEGGLFGGNVWTWIN